jgi:hypothetical protein
LTGERNVPEKIFSPNLSFFHQLILLLGHIECGDDWELIFHGNHFGKKISRKRID